MDAYVPLGVLVRAMFALQKTAHGVGKDFGIITQRVSFVDPQLTSLLKNVVTKEVHYT